MSQSQEDRLRLGHKRYGGVENSHDTGEEFICDKCGDIERSGMMTKIAGKEICEECADQYLIKNSDDYNITKKGYQCRACGFLTQKLADASKHEDIQDGKDHRMEEIEPLRGNANEGPKGYRVIAQYEDEKEAKEHAALLLGAKVDKGPSGGYRVMVKMHEGLENDKDEAWRPEEKAENSVFHYDAIVETTGSDNLMQGHIEAGSESEARRLIEKKVRDSGALGIKKITIVKSGYDAG